MLFWHLKKNSAGRKLSKLFLFSQNLDFWLQNSGITRQATKKFGTNLLYYKTLGKLRIRRMFSELMVRSTTYYIPANSACNGGCHRPSGTLIHSLYGYLGRIKDLSYLWLQLQFPVILQCCWKNIPISSIVFIVFMLFVLNQPNLKSFPGVSPGAFPLV